MNEDAFPLGYLPSMPDADDGGYTPWHAEPGWQSQDPNANYDFNIFGVWIVDGKGYWGTDSGCSCPSPWEDVRGVSDLIGGDYHQIMAAYEEYIEGYSWEETPHLEHIADRVNLAKWLVKHGL